MQEHPLMQGRNLILGLNIYYIENRPTTMGYLIKFGGGPHQNGLRISLIP